jgi:hypothetical protein
MRPFSLLSALAFFSLPVSLPGSAEITSRVVSGGGGPASAGAVELHGTLGQPAAGISTTDNGVIVAGFWNVTLEVVVETESFQNWMDTLDPADQPPPGQQGPEDTPAGDGVSNLLKYAFGLLPMEPAADALPTLIAVDGDLALEFTHDPDAAVTHVLEGSTDLENWSEISIAEENATPLANGRERLQMITNQAFSDEDRYFLRLTVNRP